MNKPIGKPVQAKDNFGASPTPSLRAPPGTEGDPAKFMFPSTLSPDPLTPDPEERLPDYDRAYANYSPNASTNVRDIATRMAGRDSHSNRSLFAQMLAIQSSIDDMRFSADEREASLRSFIQHELQRMKHSLASEVRSSKEEYFDQNQEIRELLQKRDSGPSMRENGYDTRAPVHGVHENGRDAGLAGPGVPAYTQKRESERTDVGELRAEKLPEQIDDDKPEKLKRQQTAGDRFRENNVTQKDWEEFQDKVQELDPHCLYSSVMERKVKAKSFWHMIFSHLGCPNFVEKDPPDTALARYTESATFTSWQTLLIFANTGLMAYESDSQIKAALKQPPGSVPEWLDTVNLVFNIVFAVELVFRMAALRSWFWVAPSDWGWNVLDFVLVVSSLMSDLLSGVNITFIRTFRILRAIRVARIIRVLKFFRQLRQMLFSILACLSSLAWAFVFLFMIMFMFSILFLQGAVVALDDYDATSARGQLMHSSTKHWFGSLGAAMLSLLAAVTGGADWITVRTPLDEAGEIYSIAFVVYMLFVTVGVMNVLTGVFLSSADEFIDMNLIVQNEQMKVEQFCEQMLELFHELDINHTGLIDWPTFSKALTNDAVRAYLSSLQLEPTHIHLLFELLDERSSGEIHVNDFVLGMVRLKGEAKAIDARIIQRELRMLPQIIKNHSWKNWAKLSQPALNL